MGRYKTLVLDTGLDCGLDMHLVWTWIWSSNCLQNTLPDYIIGLSMSSAPILYCHDYQLYGRGGGGGENFQVGLLSNRVHVLENSSA